MSKLPLPFAIFIIILTEILGDITGCDYLDTVDLTNYHKYENGSYQYEDVLIPKEDIGEYDYEILFDGDVEKVPKHTRGCVCKSKTCIRFCCHPKKELENGKRGCTDVRSELKYSELLNITLNNGTQTLRSLKEFMIQQHLPVPCADHSHLDAEYEPEHQWTLYENGSFLRHFDKKLLTKRDYCLQPYFLEDDLYQIVPHQCPEPPDLIPSYVQMVSVFFMLLIICVYVALPNFKGVHFKCSTCYLVCLSICFTMLICVNFQLFDKFNEFWCVSIGYFGYYLIMATFLWLLIINYNLWRAFSKIGVAQKSRFFYYNIFVWSVATVPLLITGSVNFVYNDAICNMREGHCWIQISSWSAMIYYYGPISVLLIINATLFVKTAMSILAQNKQNRSQLTKSECQRNLRNITNFSMFFRFFVTVGLIWFLEIASYLWSRVYSDTEELVIVDFLTSAQGIVLFAATILKKDVLNALANRIRGKQSKKEASSTTTSSQIAMTEKICMLKEEA